MSLETSERETVLRQDTETGEWILWTDDPAMMKLWKDRAYPVRVFSTTKGKPRSWEVRGLPSDRVVFLRFSKKSVASTGTFSSGNSKPIKRSI